MELLSMKEKLEILRDMTLEDDIFFSCCLEGSNECVSLMLRIILGRDDLSVTKTETQRWVHNILEHSVKLDVHAVDAMGNLYNIEIQKDERGAERKRARYYSAMIDSRALGKSDGYEKLPESYVIFITRGDAIGSGYALNRIDRTVAETGEPFCDGSHIVYVSSSLADEGTDLGLLMHDLRCSDPDKMHYNELRERVAYYKKEMEGIEDMSGKFEEIMQRVVERDVKKEVQKTRTEILMEGRQEVARSMVRDGSIPLSKIAEFSGLTLNEVENIRNSINA